MFLAFSAQTMVLYKHTITKAKEKVRRSGTRTPTKANTDHHNGDLK